MTEHEIIRAVKLHSLPQTSVPSHMLGPALVSLAIVVVVSSDPGTETKHR